MEPLSTSAFSPFSRSQLWSSPFSRLLLLSSSEERGRFFLDPSFFLFLFEASGPRLALFRWPGPSTGGSPSGLTVLTYSLSREKQDKDRSCSWVLSKSLGKKAKFLCSACTPPHSTLSRTDYPIEVLDKGVRNIRLVFQHRPQLLVADGQVAGGSDPVFFRRGPSCFSEHLLALVASVTTVTLFQLVNLNPI